MSTQTDDFLTQALENGGDLSPAQAAQLLQMEMGTPGDTGATALETSSGPAAAPAPTDGQNTPETPTATDESNLTANNAVVLAKDGVHTISYDKLVQAREAARTAQADVQAMAAQLEAANQKLADLQAQASKAANLRLWLYPRFRAGDCVACWTRSRPRKERPGVAGSS